MSLNCSWVMPWFATGNEYSVPSGGSYSAVIRDSRSSSRWSWSLSYSVASAMLCSLNKRTTNKGWSHERSEEHTSELQSRGHLVCRLLLEKKKQTPRHTG